MQNKISHFSLQILVVEYANAEPNDVTHLVLLSHFRPEICFDFLKIATLSEWYEIDLIKVSFCV